MSQGRQYGRAFTPIKGAGVPLVVVGGDATATQSYHSLDDSAVLVGLETLAGMEIGDEVTLVLADGGFGAVINCNVAGSNITCDFGLNVRLTALTDYVVLKRTSAINCSVVGYNLAMSAAQLIEIDAVGVIDAVEYNIALDPFGAVGGDTLSTMTGGAQGKKVRLSADNGTTKPIQIQHNAGANGFLCPNDLNLALRTANDWVEVTFSGSRWVVTGYHVSWAGNNLDAPPSNTYVQYQRVTAADFAGATAATLALPLGSPLPAGAEVLDVVMDVKVNWAGAGLTAVNVAIGTVGALGGVRANVDIYATATTAIGRGYRGAKGVGIAGPNIQANFVANTTMTTGHLASGMADFYVMYVMLPVVAP
jgi:hypothetical protein